MPLDLPSTRPSLAVAAPSVLAPAHVHVDVAIIARDPLVHAALRARLATTDEIWAVDDPAAASVLIWDPPALEPGELPALPTPNPAGVCLPVLALVDETTDPMPLLAAGVRGLLSRNVDAERLRASILAAELGLTVLDEDPVDAVVAAWSPSPESPVAAANDRLTLTPREHEVLELLSDGLSNRVIAERLGISAHTVKFHVDALLDKLAARSRTHVVVKAVRQGLLELV
jgi:DNA-binding CsgD family transcriptional regulator